MRLSILTLVALTLTTQAEISRKRQGLSSQHPEDYPVTLFPRTNTRNRRKPPVTIAALQQRLGQTSLAGASSDRPSPQAPSAGELGSGSTHDTAAARPESSSRGEPGAGSQNSGSSHNESGAGFRDLTPTRKRFPDSKTAWYSENPVKVNTYVKGPAEVSAHTGKSLEHAEEINVKAGHELRRTFENPYAAEISINATGGKSITKGWAKGRRRASARGTVSDDFMRDGRRANAYSDARHAFKVGTGVDKDPQASDIKKSKKRATRKVAFIPEAYRVSTRKGDHPVSVSTLVRGPSGTILRASNSEPPSDESRASSVSAHSTPNASDDERQA